MDTRHEHDTHSHDVTAQASGPESRGVPAPTPVGLPSPMGSPSCSLSDGYPTVAEPDSPS